MRKFNRDGIAVIYNTYQAYLKSTPSVLDQHLAEAEKDGFTLGLKLVRGAYILSINLFPASHNRASVLTAQRMHQQRVNAGLPTVPVAFGQLHGMSHEVSFSLLQEKYEAQTPPDVFKCSTWEAWVIVLAIYFGGLWRIGMRS